MLWKLLRSAFRPRANADALINRSLAVRREGRPRDAERLLREAVADFPRDVVAATNLGVVLLEQDEGEQGAMWLERALECDPRCAPAHYNLANFLRAAGRRDQALVHYQSAVDSDPGFAPAREELMHCLLQVCDWDRADVEAGALRTMIAGRPAQEWMRFVSPFTALYLGLEPALRKNVAIYHAAEYARGVQPVAGNRTAAEREGGRVRLGYLSRNFNNHPVGHLLGNAFALHDRARFEVHAYSYGPDDGSIYRKSIAAGVDHFIEARGSTDAELAAAIAQAGIDVLVDLAGHTTGNRLAVLARRPAPVQVHYLGYPATTGAAYIDYFITDHIATPPALTAEFTEQLAYLPHCFMVSDGSDAHGADAVREAERLPEAATVFCNFNNASRITREIFRTWTGILRAVPAGVLWLAGTSALTMANLRKEAHACDIDPGRLIFAQRVPSKALHIARLGLADLNLDTVGWHNGHSSTSDALWAGVPVLTAPTGSFAGRVAASLVSAAGMPELCVRSVQEYAEIATWLGNDRVQLSALTHKLADNKRTAPFFDMRQTVRDLEAAYLDMWSSYRAGPAARKHA